MTPPPSSLSMSWTAHHLEIEVDSKKCFARLYRICWAPVHIWEVVVFRFGYWYFCKIFTLLWNLNLCTSKYGIRFCFWWNSSWTFGSHLGNTHSLALYAYLTFSFFLFAFNYQKACVCDLPLAGVFVVITNCLITLISMGLVLGRKSIQQLIHLFVFSCFWLRFWD